MDQRIRILWLSDIHYSADYKSKNTDFKKFIATFIKYVINLNNNNPFDYILLSGDIAQEGEKGDFDQFTNDILNPLQKEIKEATLLIVPGNHDVSRVDAKYIADFVENLPHDRTGFLKTNIDSFRNAFKNYSDAFKDNKKLPNTSSSLKENALLYGHVLDLEKKTVFVLLNSAWYSIGQGFLEEYMSIILKNKVNNKDVIKNIKNIAEEYGNQLVGLDVLSGIKEIINIIEKYNDFIIITIMHHPINWLDWNERVITNNKNRLHLIKKHSDLLLTGHEHVPKMHKVEKLNNNELLHIQAGCFLEYHEKTIGFKKEKIKDCWFSTLQININKRTVIQEKHFYNIEEDDWENENIEYNNKLKRKYNSRLSKTRYNDFNIKALDFKNMLSIIYSDNDVKEINTGYFHLKNRLYKHIDNDFFNNLSSSILKGVIKESNVNTVCFILIDLNHEKHKLYLKEDKLAVLQKIKKDFDFKFDAFRHLFFKNLESVETIKYSNLKFIGIILPYWEIETFL